MDFFKVALLSEESKGREHTVLHLALLLLSLAAAAAAAAACCCCLGGELVGGSTNPYCTVCSTAAAILHIDGARAYELAQVHS